MSLTTISPPPRGDPLPAAGGPVLWLVRHGQSTWNALGLAQGQSDQPRLTARGARQARDVTNQLRGCPIGAVYASDLQRAVVTAAPLAAALGLTAYLRGVPVERMSWEPVANGTIVRLPLQPRQRAISSSSAGAPRPEPAGLAGGH